MRKLFGCITAFGDTKTVASKYQEFISWFNKLSEKEKSEYKKEQLSKQSVLKKNTATKRRGNFVEGLKNALVIIPVIIFAVLLVSGV